MKHKSLCDIQCSNSKLGSHDHALKWIKYDLLS